MTITVEGHDATRWRILNRLIQLRHRELTTTAKGLLESQGAGPEHLRRLRHHGLILGTANGVKVDFTHLTPATQVHLSRKGVRDVSSSPCSLVIRTLSVSRKRYVAIHKVKNVMAYCDIDESALFGLIGWGLIKGYSHEDRQPVALEAMRSIPGSVMLLLTPRGKQFAPRT